jgi:hypothetical protein
MRRADNRPRIHLWPRRDGWDWSIGPVGRRKPAATPGAGLDAALEQMDFLANGGAVVIVEVAGR